MVPSQLNNLGVYEQLFLYDYLGLYIITAPPVARAREAREAPLRSAPRQAPQAPLRSAPRQARASEGKSSVPVEPWLENRRKTGTFTEGFQDVDPSLWVLGGLGRLKRNGCFG